MVLKSSGHQVNWLNAIMSLFSSQIVNIPGNFREQSIEAKKVLKDDTSGLVNSILDFAIESALVEFSVEVDNKNLRKILNAWLGDINGGLRGKIPTGIRALAKEYFRERWKGSSLLFLNTVWDTQDGLKVPTQLWFVEGEDIIIEPKVTEDGAVLLGEDKYYFWSTKADKNKGSQLGTGDDQRVFVQKPYESWGTKYPTPFLIRRGLFHNLQVHAAVSSKAETVVKKALEYLFLMKKGDKDLAKTGKDEFVYSKEDLDGVKKAIEEFREEVRTSNKLPAHITGFDTEIDHIIPDYGKVLSQEVYSNIEKRLLAGLGLVEIVEGTSSTRRETILNPKAFMVEVNSAIEDFKSLLQDILITIAEENKTSRRKYAKQKIRVRTTPVKHFISDDVKSLLRSVYDRGSLSKRTLVDLGCDVDFDTEVQRRKEEDSSGINEIMYPPVILNVEGITEEDNDPDKQGPEKRNFEENDLRELLSKHLKKKKKKKGKSYSSVGVVSLLTSENDGHRHNVTVSIEFDKDGNIVGATGETDEADGHTHKVSDIHRTDEVDGHNHSFPWAHLKFPSGEDVQS